MEEKRKRIAETMRLWGISSEEMVETWLKNGDLSLLYLQNLVKSFEDVDIKVDVFPGWYAFEGFRFSPDPNAFPNLQGVVAFVDEYAPKGKRIGVLLPKGVNFTCYQNEYGKIGAVDENDGGPNSKIMNRIVEGERDLFVCPGVSDDQIFIPAKNQAAKLTPNIHAINSALSAIDGDKVDFFTWTSTEVNERIAWAIYYPKGNLMMTDKKHTFAVRRMFLL